MKSESLEGVTEAWRRYVKTGRVARELLRERTYVAWVRCHEHGTNPDVSTLSRLTTAETAERVREEVALIDAARPYLRALSDAAGTEPHAALLSDGRGVVLDIVADDETIAAQRSGHFPGPGVLMGERDAGSNGIGTALAEHDYVEVIGPEHFVERLRSFTCQGLPLRGPKANVAGALAISVRSLTVADRLREMLFCAANGIEAELSRERLEALEEEIARALSHHDTRLVDELGQDLACVRTGALHQLQAAAQMARESPPENLRPLLLAIDGLVQRFKRQSDLWREIAGEDDHPPSRIDVDELVEEMIELFDAEAAVRGVRVTLRTRSNAQALSDHHTFARLLFRAFMDAFGAASRGGEVAIDVLCATGDSDVKVAFSTGHDVVLLRATTDDERATTPRA